MQRRGVRDFTRPMGQVSRHRVAGTVLVRRVLGQGRPGVYPGLLDRVTGNLRPVGRIPTSHAEGEEAKARVHARRQQVRQTVRTRGLPGRGCGAGAELRLRISRNVG